MGTRRSGCAEESLKPIAEEGRFENIKRRQTTAAGTGAWPGRMRVYLGRCSRRIVGSGEYAQDPRLAKSCSKGKEENGWIRGV